MTHSKDSRQRFLFDNLPIRGEMVQLSQTVADVFANHQYPAPVKKLVGEFMAASALLSATIKFEGSLILQVKGTGQVSMLMAECRNQQSMRGIARYSEDFDAELPMLGDGQMAITIEPDKGERYQGIVLIEDGTLAKTLEDYFLQSEQLRTKFWLASSETEAAGMLLQAMPESASESSLSIESEDWNRLVMLSDTLQDEELLQLDIDEVLHRLFHEENLRMFESSYLRFECSCSQERSANALLSMGETETRSLLAERDGCIDIDCQFCYAKYQFNEQAVNQLFHSQVH